MGGTLSLMEYLTPEQVAERLGRNVQLIRRWIRQGQLEAELVGRMYFVRPGVVRRFEPPLARPRRKVRTP